MSKFWLYYGSCALLFNFGAFIITHTFADCLRVGVMIVLALVLGIETGFIMHNE